MAKLLALVALVAVGLIDGCQAQALGSKEHVNSKLFETKLAQLNRDDVKLVQILANEFSAAIGPNILGYKFYWPEYTPFLAHFRSVSDKAPIAVYKTLQKLATPEQSSNLRGQKEDVRNSEIESMVGQVLDGCSRYVKSLAKTIESISPDAETKYEPQYGSESLMNGWVNYEYCHQLLASHQSGDSLALRVIEFATRTKK